MLGKMTVDVTADDLLRCLVKDLDNKMTAPGMDPATKPESLS
jgi:hypothetical protein